MRSPPPSCVRLWVCPEYLQGVARALIEAIAMRARADGVSRYYWLTQENNAVARALYDKVAQYNGFIRYEMPLNAPRA